MGDLMGVNTLRRAVSLGSKGATSVKEHPGQREKKQNEWATCFFHGVSNQRTKIESTASLLKSYHYGKQPAAGV